MEAGQQQANCNSNNDGGSGSGSDSDSDCDLANHRDKPERNNSRERDPHTLASMLRPPPPCVLESHRRTDGRTDAHTEELRQRLTASCMHSTMMIMS